VHHERAGHTFWRHKGSLPSTAATIENKEHRIDFCECIWNCRCSASELTLT